MYGRTTHVFCDNAAIVQILSNGSSSPEARIRNTAAKLIGYKLIVHHMPGALLRAADALSRDSRFKVPIVDNEPMSPSRPTLQIKLFDSNVAMAAAVLSIDELLNSNEELAHRVAAGTTDVHTRLKSIIALQQSDPGFELLRKIAAGSQPTTEQAHSAAWRLACRLRPHHANIGDWKNALFVCINDEFRLAIPDGMRSNITRLVHGPSHLGANYSVELACRYFWWPSMYSDIRKSVKACAQCQRVNGNLRQAPGNLGDSEALGPPARCGQWEIDSFAVGATLDGHRVITVVERFSGCIWSLVVESASAEDALEAYITLIERPHGHPRRVFVDSGSEFLGAFKSHLQANGVEIVVGLVENHHHVARAERTNRTTLNRLRQFYLMHDGEAPSSKAVLQRWLDTITATHNSIPRSVGGYSSAELLYGYNRLSALASLVPDEVISSLVNFGDDHTPASSTLVESVRRHRAALLLLDEDRALWRARERAASEAAYAKRNGAPRDFKVDDLVMARVPPKDRDDANKFNDGLEWCGVWRISKLLPERQSAVLQLLMPIINYQNAVAVDEEITVHVSNLRDFIEGSPIDSSELNAPLDVSALPVGMPSMQSLNPSEFSAMTRAAVERLLTNKQRDRLHRELDAAAEQLSARLLGAGHSAVSSSAQPVSSSSTSSTPATSAPAKETSQQQLKRSSASFSAPPAKSKRRSNVDLDAPPITPIVGLRTSKMMRIISYSAQSNMVTGLAVFVNNKKYEFGRLIERPVSELLDSELRLLEAFKSSRELGLGRK
jgi:hypothetical protein